MNGGLIECRGGFIGWLFGHRMTPRYDTMWEWPTAKNVTVNFGPDCSADEFQDHRKLYRCDVCERCGYTTEPPEDA